MAAYDITAPDGTKWTVNAPEGASQDQVLEYAKSQWSAKSQEQKPAKFNLRALGDTIMDLPRYGDMAGKSVKQGLMDLPVGAGQLVSNIAGLAFPSVKERYDNAMQTRENLYQGERQAEGIGTPDVGRVAGNVVASIPIAPAKAAPSLLGRMGQGAQVGGMLGLTAPVDPNSQDYWLTKGAQTAASTAGGFLAPPVVEGAVKGAGAITNAVANKGRGLLSTVTGQASPQTITQTLKLEFERGGADWSKLPQAIRTGLVEDAQAAIKGGGTLDPEMAKRLADFRLLGIDPTKGQISRDPLQFAREVNLGKMEVGAPIAARLNEQNTGLIGAVDAAKSRVGATAPDEYAAGKTIISALQNKDAARKGAVDAAYTAAREKVGVEADVPLQPLAQRLGQVIEDFGDDKIPAAVMKRLNEFGVNGGKQTRVFNIREAEKLKTLIGNNIDAPGTPTAKALTMLKGSIDEAVGGLEGAGGEAGAAFGEARKLAAGRFGQIDRTPALASAISKTDTPAPEKFIEKHFIRGDLTDVANAMKTLTPEARSEARGAVIEWIKSKGISGAGNEAKFNQASFNKALDSIGERKLSLIFAGDKATLEQLKAAGRVGRYVQSPPISSGVNYSNSATTLLDTMDRATRLPLVGPLLGKPSDIIRASQTASALGPVAPVTPGQGLLTPELLDSMSRRSGLLAAPVPGLLALGAVR